MNGKFVGEHLYTQPDDWKLPFAIPISDAIDWNQEKQTVIVRVEDKAGAGGIWRPILLAVRFLDPETGRPVTDLDITLR